jgi:Flp pilus assembly pilin Flp
MPSSTVPIVSIIISLRITCRRLRNDVIVVNGSRLTDPDTGPAAITSVRFGIETPIPEEYKNMLKYLAAELRAIRRDQRGISAMEYAILAAAIIGVVATAAATVATDLGSLLNAVAAELVNAASGL